jgi:hypothetical protein
MTKMAKTKTQTQTIVELCHDKTVFGPWFKKRFFQSANSWAPWFSFMKVLFGLVMDEQDAELYRQCTGRSDTPSGFTEAWLCCGRRGGKSFVLSVIAVYLACFKDWSPYLQRGERATIAILAKDPVSDHLPLHRRADPGRTDAGTTDPSDRPRCRWALNSP